MSGDDIVSQWGALGGGVAAVLIVAGLAAVTLFWLIVPFILWDIRGALKRQATAMEHAARQLYEINEREAGKVRGERAAQVIRSQRP